MDPYDISLMRGYFGDVWFVVHSLAIPDQRRHSIAAQMEEEAELNRKKQKLHGIPNLKTCYHF